MTYIQRSIKKDRSSLTYILILLVFILILGLLSRTENVRNLASSALAPFFNFGSKIFSDGTITPKWFIDRSNLISEIDRLTKELEIARINVRDTEALNFENNRLRTELGLLPHSSFVRASIIGRPPQMPYDNLLINRGQSHGVEVGALVLGSERSIVGRVREVSSNFATVELTSASTALLSGIISRTGEVVELRGSGGGTISTHVPIEFDIQVGDTVLFSYESNYVAAIVGVVETNQAQGNKTVLLSLPVNISKTETVYIVLDSMI